MNWIGCVISKNCCSYDEAFSTVESDLQTSPPLLSAINAAGGTCLIPSDQKNTPRNIIALTRFPVLTRWNGVKMRNKGRILKMQAQAGRMVVPVRTAAKEAASIEKRLP